MWVYTQHPLELDMWPIAGLPCHSWWTSSSCAGHVDLRAIRQLQRSSLAIDLYIWLTYRMSCLRKPTVIPWESLQDQFGAAYARPRDFRRKVMTQLQEVLRLYPTVRVSQTGTGLRLYPSPPHVQGRPDK